MIILTTVKIHTIFYPYTSLLDKYCEKRMCNYTCRKFKTGHGIAGQCFSIQPLKGVYEGESNENLKYFLSHILLNA